VNWIFSDKDALSAFWRDDKLPPDDTLCYDFILNERIFAAHGRPTLPLREILERCDIVPPIAMNNSSFDIRLLQDMMNALPTAQINPADAQDPNMPIMARTSNGNSQPPIKHMLRMLPPEPRKNLTLKDVPPIDTSVYTAKYPWLANNSNDGNDDHPEQRSL
jgi:hypothetical protein